MVITSLPSDGYYQGEKKKLDNYNHWQEWGEIITHVYYGLECKMIQLLWKTVGKFLKKLNKDLAYDPTIPLLGR